MARPSMRMGPPRLWVGDTGMLMNEVVQSVRNGLLTSALASLHHDSARLFVAHHVLLEMDRDLRDFANSRGIDASAAATAWRDRYLPYVRVVNVPVAWGKHDPGVMAVADRHRTDLPTARLAAALAPCHALVEDRDLTDNGFGDSNWLRIAHASANRAIIELHADTARLLTVLLTESTKYAYRSAARLPSWAHLLVGAAVAAGICYWHHNGHAPQHLAKITTLLGEAARACGPILTTIAAREQQAQATWLDNVVVVRGRPSTAEQLARLLAVADGAMTATELARALGASGPLQERTTLVRAELRQSEAFTEFSRGRWQLGERAVSTKPLISPLEVAAWLQRAHGLKAQQA